MPEVKPEKEINPKTKNKNFLKWKKEKKTNKNQQAALVNSNSTSRK